MQKLPVEFKTKWVEALRSGKYKQGKGFLRSINDEFCCLGVAYDLCGGKWFESNGGVYQTKLGNMRMPMMYSTLQEEDGYHNDLPKDIVDSFTSHLEDGAMYAGRVANTLAHMNDEQNKSFVEIADYIEANL